MYEFKKYQCGRSAEDDNSSLEGEFGQVNATLVAVAGSAQSDFTPDGETVVPLLDFTCSTRALRSRDIWAVPSYHKDMADPGHIETEGSRSHTYTARGDLFKSCFWK